MVQFVQPGWDYVGGQGSGLLPGGGSWVAYIPPPGRAVSAGPRPSLAQAAATDFSLVVEKLEGACLRCSVNRTTAETVSFALAGPLLQARVVLAVWLTNATHGFVQMPDLVVTNGQFSLTVPRDTIISLTTTSGQAHGSAAEPPADAPV